MHSTYIKLQTDTYLSWWLEWVLGWVEGRAVKAGTPRRDHFVSQPQLKQLKQQFIYDKMMNCNKLQQNIIKCYTILKLWSAVCYWGMFSRSIQGLKTRNCTFHSAFFSDQFCKCLEHRQGSPAVWFMSEYIARLGLVQMWNLKEL